jgi:hypothetical protein
VRVFIPKSLRKKKPGNRMKKRPYGGSKSGAERFKEFLPIFDAANLDAQARMPYDEYLKTEYWRRIRLVVLAYSRHRCERCERGGMLQVHHKSYAFRGREHLAIDTLEALCESCHRKEHGIAEVVREPDLQEPVVLEQIDFLKSFESLTALDLIRLLPTRPCRNHVVRVALAKELEQRWIAIQAKPEPLREIG